MENVYIPKLTTIKEIVTENDANDLKTYKLEFQDEGDWSSFEYVPGQFAEISLIGEGEFPIGIASSPTEKGFLLFTIKKTGQVTSKVHDCEVGQTLGIRGPFGNGWPVGEMRGRNVVIVGGGFAFTTLRSMIEYMLDDVNRPNFGDITVVYGARTPGDLLYDGDLNRWEQRDDINLVLTIDAPQDGWTRKVGYVPSVLKDTAPSSDNAVAVVCGPPVMIRFSIPVLVEAGFPDEKIFLSLENRMKCGVGKCGHCMVGNKYVCLDGPVFSQAELKKLPREY
ncbi:MAG: FAD/NAD(P)-binding protein [Promethearchaeota archaeon]